MVDVEEWRAEDGLGSKSCSVWLLIIIHFSRQWKRVQTYREKSRRQEDHCDDCDGLHDFGLLIRLRGNAHLYLAVTLGGGMECLGCG